MLLVAWALLALSGSAPTQVSSITVSPPTPPPRMVASYPANGGAAPPGVLVLKLTFDQKMLKTGFDIAAGPAGEAPECVKTPRLLDDGKTFVLLCTTLPGKSYVLSLNGGPAGGFANVAERRAEPASLAFTTTDGEPVRSLAAAMKLESLTELEIPVQETPIR